MPARPASAAAAHAPMTPDAAAQACERAARQSFMRQGTPFGELKFSAPPTVQPALSNGSQIVLQGSGTWRSDNAARRFDFSCNLDLRNPDSVGLVLRDTTPPAPEPRPARPAIEPDLSHLSPAACESGAAAVLKKRWPQVSQISFDAATRSLVQDSASKALLRGQGRAQTVPGGPFTLFGFDCELDPRDGRVLATRISG